MSFLLIETKPRPLRDSKWDTRTQSYEASKVLMSRTKRNLGHKQLKHIQILRNK